MAKKTDEEPRTSLEDFVIPQKITAFCEAFSPCTKAAIADEIFTDSRLREFFKAYVCSMGDPLAIYIQRLYDAGFALTVTMSGEPAFMVTRRIS